MNDYGRPRAYREVLVTMDMNVRSYLSTFAASPTILLKRLYASALQG